MDFSSDNVASVADEIMDAIAAANVGSAAAYGDDGVTRRLEPAYSELCETELPLFPGLTGARASARRAFVGGGRRRGPPPIDAAAGLVNARPAERVVRAIKALVG